MYKILTKLKSKEIEKLTGFKVRGNFITRKVDGNINRIKICIPVDPNLILDEDKSDIIQRYLKTFCMVIGPNDRYVVGMEVTPHLGFFCIHIAFLNDLTPYERTNIILAELITGINTFGEKEIEYIKGQAVSNMLGDINIEEFNKYVKPIMNDKKIFFIVEHNNPDLVIDIEVNDEFDYSKDVQPLSDNTGYMIGNDKETTEMWLYLTALIFIFNLKGTSRYMIKDNKLLISIKSIVSINNLGTFLRTVINDIKDDEGKETFINSLLTSYMCDEEELKWRESHSFIEKYLLFDNPYIDDINEFSEFMKETLFNKELLEKFISLIDEKSVTEVDMDEYKPS